MNAQCVLWKQTLACVGAFALAVLTVAPAEAAPQPKQYCQAVYEPDVANKKPDQPYDLKLISYSCGTEEPVTAQVNRMFVKAFQYSKYQGDSINLEISQWWGVNDCDQDGYRWSSMPSGWSNKISSYRVYDTCYGSRIYALSNTSGDCASFYDDVQYVGNFMNNRTSSMRVQSIKRTC